MRIEQIDKIVILIKELLLDDGTYGTRIIISRLRDWEREVPVTDIPVSFKLFSCKTAEYVELIFRLKTFFRVIDDLLLYMVLCNAYHVVIVGTCKSLVSGKNVVTDLPGLAFFLLVKDEERVSDIRELRADILHGLNANPEERIHGIVKCHRAAHFRSADKLHSAGHLTDVAYALLSFLYGTEGFHNLLKILRTCSISRSRNRPCHSSSVYSVCSARNLSLYSS